jgi:hypothetical protein
MGTEHYRAPLTLYPNATVEKESPAKTAGHPKHDKPATAHPVANDQSLPKNWDEIDINHVVLGKDDSRWGAWWEAVPVEVAPTTMARRPSVFVTD